MNVKLERVLGHTTDMAGVQPSLTMAGSSAAPEVAGQHGGLMGHWGDILAGRLKRRRCPVGGFSVVSAVVCAGVITQPAMGQVCNYEVVVTLQGEECSPGNFASFGAQAIDERGNVAGAVACGITPTAAVWVYAMPPAQELLGPPSISESTAFDLFNPEHAVGRAQPIGQNTYRAAYWSDGQGVLLPLLPGADTGQAFGISASLVIVGETNNSIS